jgi:arginase
MTPDSQRITLIDVPTEAGTHFPGQSKAPQALRDAGLAQKLQDAGYTTHSKLALRAPQPWRPTDLVNGVRDEENALAVMTQVFDSVLNTATGQDGEPKALPLVLGGDCSISPAVLKALSSAHADKKVGIVYFDGDADLTLPLKPGESTAGFTGILDSMVLSHLTQREGGLKTMSDFCSGPGGAALVNERNIVLFGFQPEELRTEHWTFLLEGGFKAFTRPAVSKDPAGKAREALQWLGDRVDAILLHFDVDVIDSGKFPLGNYPHYAGLMFEEAMAALGVFVGSEKLVGMVLTEVNPNNDPSGEMVGMLVDGVVGAFAGRMSGCSSEC